MNFSSIKASSPLADFARSALAKRISASASVSDDPGAGNGGGGDACRSFRWKVVSEDG
jgi:hypothetical protein